MSRGKKKPGEETNPMVKVINAGLEGIHETSHVLSRIWRIILYKSNITGNQWRTLLAKRSATSKRKHTDKTASSWAGNITRSLSAKSITWNTLIQGLSILEYEKLDIKLTLWKRGKSSEFEFTLENLAKAGDDGEDEQTEEQ